MVKPDKNHKGDRMQFLLPNECPDGTHHHGLVFKQGAAQRYSKDVSVRSEGRKYPKRDGSPSSQMLQSMRTSKELRIRRALRKIETGKS